MQKAVFLAGKYSAINDSGLCILQIVSREAFLDLLVENLFLRRCLRCGLEGRSKGRLLVQARDRVLPAVLNLVLFFFGFFQNGS